MEEMHRARYKEGSEILCLFWVYHFPWISILHQPRCSLNIVLLGFYEGFITQARLGEPWPSVIDLTSSLSLCHFPGLSCLSPHVMPILPLAVSQGEDTKQKSNKRTEVFWARGNPGATPAGGGWLRGSNGKNEVGRGWLKSLKSPSYQNAVFLLGFIQ